MIESYRTPLETFETNVLGTVNLLDSAFRSNQTKAFLSITTDKVYRNDNNGQAFKESDALSGKDPYSASKVGSEAAIAAWQQIAKSSGGPKVVATRAGNVIGGGDWAQDRIIPDLVNSYSAGSLPTLRFPDAIRPWQHVLDCLNGYIKLSEALLSGNGQGEWNFGPETSSFVNVGDVATYVQEIIGESAPNWTTTGEPQPHEANLLALDARKAELELDWHNKLSFKESLKWTVDWQVAVNSGENANRISMDQISLFK